MSQPIYVTGSDGNQYLIESERVGYNTTELSLIVGKTKINKDMHLDNNNLPKALVEQYILQTKDRYSPSIHKIVKLKHLLNVAQINNHFDYLALLHRVNPILDELLQ